MVGSLPRGVSHPMSTRVLLATEVPMVDLWTLAQLVTGLCYGFVLLCASPSGATVVLPPVY